MKHLNAPTYYPESAPVKQRQTQTGCRGKFRQNPTHAKSLFYYIYLKPKRMNKFIEVTYKQSKRIINIQHIVEAVKIDDKRVSISLINGTELTVEVSYNELKNTVETYDL